MNTELTNRIETLRKQLYKIANDFAGSLEADDIFQAMAEAILTKANPKDSNSRILTLARWTAKNAVKAETVYSFYVGEEGDVQFTSDDDEEDGDCFEYYVADTQNPEEVVINRESERELSQAVLNMAPKYQQVVRLLRLGYNQIEIAKAVGVTESAISQRIVKLATMFESAALTAA